MGPGHKAIADEAIGSVNIAAMYCTGPFESVQVRIADDLNGKKGRSRTRNDAVKDSEADWVFFLDADDLLHPAAFDVAFSSIRLNEAVWGSIVEYRDGLIYERYQVPRVSSLEQLIKFDPTHTIQIGHFVKHEIALQYPFDEDMDTGEDWDYYLRIWKDCKCIKIDKPLMINRRGSHSTGPRSATGAEWNQAVGKLIDNARNTWA